MVEVIDTREWIVTYQPYPLSDMTGEAKIPAVSAEEAEQVFKATYPLWLFKSVREA